MNFSRAARRVLAACGLIACASPALAWFDEGHETIAAAAYSQLTPDAREAAGRLLRLNPDYAAWTAGAADSERDRIAFVHAATWADDIKRREDFARGSLGGDGAHAVDNIGYADRRMHAYWHYMDLPFSGDGSPTRPAESPNALTQIRAFAATLRSNAPDSVKSYDLVWLEHLVGDAHQPLHATSRFSRRLPAGDNGGNQERICRAFVCGLKLHAFWDSLLGDSNAPRDAIAAAARLPAPDPARAAETDPQVWFEESAGLAREAVYTAAIGDGEGPFDIDAAYQANAKAVARDQAALAAARLAHMLNAALAK
ncbi:S1/P1 Nuclease [Rhodoblastus acidophilus]|uniref:S1/P1 Nuclease n=1 Tax=Rhodoblastus acidophilus TaxID=1074 RepID=A0A212RII0_RHOAC|nr:S1/P1 nuclease [Rhodoblastus acidophilus]SNB72251.1 S1/P1 Nuclease [Rhodoblastus acidophilus]